MKNLRFSPWHYAKKYFVGLSCVTVLAAASFIAKPVLADTVETEPTNTSEILMTTNQSQPSTDVETVTPPTTETSLNTLKTELGSQASNSTSEDTVPQAVSSNSEVPATSSADSYTGGDNVSVSAKNNLVTSESKGYHSDEQGNWYYADGNGNKLTGAQIIDSVKVYFDENGIQVKGNFAPDGHYYDKDSGAMLTKRYVEVAGNWYYVNDEGDKLIGTQTVDSVKVYFDENGIQVKGNFAPDGHYYDKDSGAMLTKRYVEVAGNWYYVDGNGNKLIGAQTVDSVKVYFDENGVQVKGAFAPAKESIFSPDRHYYDKDSGALVTNRYVEVDGNWYYVDENGRMLTGYHTIDGVEVYFSEYDGHQAKGEFSGNGDTGDFYDWDSGARITGKEGTPKFIKTRSGHWYYLNEKGNQVTSIQIIDGNIYYFGLPTKKYYYGMQSRGELVYAYYSDFIPNSSHIYYTDPETGAAWKNRYVDWEGSRYYMGPEGYALIGEAVVNGQSVYFHRDGKQARGELITENGVTRYYAPDSGVRVRNTKLTIDGVTYNFNADGDGTIISD